MTLTEVFDALCGRHVSRIDFKDGSHVVAAQPYLVDFADADTPAEGWIGVSEDGLMFHFNATRISPTSHSGGMVGQEEPLANIAHVA
jgi:hypothetical protein